jgi:ankyrin repeat protein
LNGHRETVQFLLDHGADRNVKDTKVDSTAAGWAEHSGHKDLAALLR